MAERISGNLRIYVHLSHAGASHAGAQAHYRGAVDAPAGRWRCEDFAVPRDTRLRDDGPAGYDRAALRLLRLYFLHLPVGSQPDFLPRTMRRTTLATGSATEGTFAVHRSPRARVRFLAQCAAHAEPAEEGLTGQ